MAEKKNATVIAIGNQKGGVGKTSNTLHIAAGLGELKYKVLVIDLDANRGSTRALRLGKDWAGTFEVLLGTEEDPMNVIVTEEDDGVTLPQNVHVLPARRDLETFDKEFRNAKGKFQNAVDCLERPLALLRPEYDFILLDTAPNTMTPTVAAYRSADWFLLVSEATQLSLEGLGDALKDIDEANQNRETKLKLLGVVMCKVAERTRTASTYMQKIQAMFARADYGAFDTVITRAIAIEDAQGLGKTLFQTEPGHKVTALYRQLLKEILKRLKAAEAQPEMKVAANG
jgi:chromosome partitioning protein